MYIFICMYIQIFVYLYIYAYASPSRALCFASSLSNSASGRAGPGARNLGAPLPFLLIDLADGGARGREEYCLTTEAFAPVRLFIIDTR